jgi:hypothetical protein
LNEIEKQLKELPSLPRPRLLGMWKECFGRNPAAGIRRELMVPVLAYRLQEQAYGGLKKETLARLRQLAHESEKGRASLVRAERVKTGTRILRQWRGETHEVTVGSREFLYRGKAYKSLSEIARLITGTRWSGPLFFGLKRRSADGGGQ